MQAQLTILTILILWLIVPLYATKLIERNDK